MLTVLVSGVIVYGSTARRGPDLHFESAVVDRGRIVARVSATGTLSALVTVQVGSQVSGRIKAIFVDFSSPVKKGQVIAQIDRQMFRAAAEQARATPGRREGESGQGRGAGGGGPAAVAASGVPRRARSWCRAQRWRRGRPNTRRRRRAWRQRAGASSRRGRRSTRRRSASLTRRSCRPSTALSSHATWTSARRSRPRCSRRRCSRSPRICARCRSTRLSPRRTSASSGPDVAATFTVDAYPDERFQGVIRQIRDAAQTVQNVVTYDAVVDVDNPDLKLKPGMTANVTFVYAERTDVLRVPSAALRFRPPPSLLDQQPGDGHKKNKQSKADKQASGRPPTGPAARGGARSGCFAARPRRRCPSRSGSPTEATWSCWRATYTKATRW